MSKYKRYSLVTLICWISQLSAAYTQHEFVDIEKKFTAFSSQSFHEKIYLHTDKNFYIAGEIMWFKVYCVDAADHQPVNLSKVAYIELLDRTGKPALQAKVELDSLGGAGSFYLPVTLSSDNYVLRAYTNWMKNDGSAVFFQKNISVVNTVKAPATVSNADTVGVIATFFPEGGNLVEGLPAKMGFKIADSYGKGIAATGYIVGNNSDTTVNFSTVNFGMGSFMLTPKTDQQYRAVITLSSGKTFSTPLPTVFQHGYVMSVTDNKDGRFKITIKAKGKDPLVRGENVLLVAHTRQSLKKTITGYVNYENELILYVDRSSLGDGISHFTLFNRDRQPVCERLVFKKPVNRQNVNIQIDKASLKPRQKAGLLVSTSAGDSLELGGNYSLAVYQLDSLQQPGEDDITSYLWLSSDLKGNIESPGFYFEENEKAEQALDNLLLTQGWRRFRWEDVFSDKKKVKSFIPENRGHLVAVKVVHAATGRVAADIPCFLSYPSSPFGFSVARSDTSGIAYFDVKNYYGPGDIFVQAGIDTQSLYRADVLTPFSDDNKPFNYPSLSISNKNAEWLINKSIGMQAQNVFLADSIRRYTVPLLADTLPFFGNAEYSYRLDDYKRFTTMEEVLREYVAPINVVLRNGKLYLSVYDINTQTVYTDQVLVLIDGVPLMNFQKIFFYDPLKVKKLDVVPRRYVAGGLYFKGIASFETYQGKFDGFDIAPGLVAIDYEGLQLQREFYSPAYEKESDRQKRIPDFRTTLYWSPYMQTGKTPLQFYTSDTKGKFLVVLQGINRSGETVSATNSFTVE